MALAQMVKTRSEGGLGITDYGQLQFAACISRTVRLWNGNWVWTAWIEKRYIQGRALDDIQAKSSDLHYGSQF